MTLLATFDHLWESKWNPIRNYQTVSLETVWKVGGGFLIACVSCFKRTRWDIFALFWLLAILQIEAYWDFPDSLLETVWKIAGRVGSRVCRQREAPKRVPI